MAQLKLNRAELMLFLANGILNGCIGGPDLTCPCFARGTELWSPS